MFCVKSRNVVIPWCVFRSTKRKGGVVCMIEKQHQESGLQMNSLVDWWGSWVPSYTKETSFPRCCFPGLFWWLHKSKVGMVTSTIVASTRQKLHAALSQHFFCSILWVCCREEPVFTDLFCLTWPPFRLFKMVRHQLSHGLLWMEERLEACHVRSSPPKFAEMVETSKQKWHKHVENGGCSIFQPAYVRSSKMIILESEKVRKWAGKAS